MTDDARSQRSVPERPAWIDDSVCGKPYDSNAVAWFCDRAAGHEGEHSVCIETIEWEASSDA